MEHHEHVNLIRAGIAEQGGICADLGSGWGAFTLALADLLGSQAQIISVDKDRRSLREQEEAMRVRFPQVAVEYREADFMQPLSLPPLDGLLMTNALHYVKDKSPLLERLRGYLKPGGRFLLVEYNTNRGNPWVPYPLTYTSWEKLVSQHGFVQTRLLGRQPSRYLREMYAALSFRAA